MRVRWLKTAKSNLDAAIEHIAQEDLGMATKVYAHIQERVAALGVQPSMGRPGRIFGTRELVIEKYPYLIPYRIRDNEVHILRVFHTSQKSPKAW